MKKKILFITVLLSQLGLFGQIILVPGSKLINTKNLRFGSREYMMRFIDASGKEKSKSKTEKRLVMGPGKDEVLLIQKSELRGDLITDSTIAQFKTLTPKRMSMNSTSNTIKMNLYFDNDRVKAYALRNGIKTDTVHKMDTKYFDSNLLETILEVIDYTADSTFIINTYTHELAGNDQYFIRKLGKETIGLNDYEYKTWHIMIFQTNKKLQANVPGIEFWIDEKEKMMVKEIISFGEAKGKYEITIKR